MTTAATSHDDHAHDGHGDHGHHIVSLRFLFVVFAALMVLTAITVGAIYLDFGRAGNVIVALAIAAVKAFLVGAFFMHLWWDRPFNAFVISCSLFFVTLFIAWTMLDTAQYADRVAAQDFQNQQIQNAASP